MSASDCVDDLLVFERRRTLTAGERRTLAEHLARCKLCRMARSVGMDLGAMPADELDDDALAARLIARALTPRMALVPAVGAHGRSPEVTDVRRRWRPWRPRRLAAAAALLLMAGTASAALWRWSTWPAEWSLRGVPSLVATQSTAPRRNISVPRAPAEMPPPEQPTPPMTTLPTPEAPTPPELRAGGSIKSSGVSESRARYRRCARRRRPRTGHRTDRP